MADRGQYAELSMNSHPASQPDQVTYTEVPAPSGIHIVDQQITDTSRGRDIPSSEEPSSSSRNHGIIRSWGLQLASAVLGILCFIALLVITTKIHNTRLSSWTLPITPNAVISILSTASQVTIVYASSETISQLKWINLAKQPSKLRYLQVFDDASRGAWGSVKFFWLARQTSILAYLSSLIIICSLAVSPFSQQILSYPQFPTLVTGAQSSVTKSQTYDYGSKGVSGTSSVISSSRDGALEAAAISGLYNLIHDPPFACPGSNCTYPGFTTMGVASNCTDVTASTVQSCNNSAGYPEIQCNYTLPGGANGYGLNLTSEGLTSAHSGWEHTTIDVTNIIPMDYDISMNTSSPLLQIGVIMFDDSDMTDESYSVSTEWESTLQATVCDFSLVAQTYGNSTSKNGTIQPGSIKNWPLGSVYHGPYWNLTVENEDFPGDPFFIINMFDFENIIQILSSCSSYSDAIYYNGDVPTTMENIATGMSYQMLSGPNATTIYGDVFAVESYIHVNRDWLILTIILSCSSALILLAVIVQTHTARVRPWKSKLDPLIYGFAPTAADRGESIQMWSEEHKDPIPRRQTIMDQLKR